MRMLFFYIIFLKFTELLFSVIPLWNFENAAHDLLSNKNEYEYTVSSGNIWGENSELFEIKRKIYRQQNGTIKEENRLYLNNVDFGLTKYDDIESAFLNNNGTYFICPKGKFHVHFYNKNNGTNDIINLGINSNYWDLKCHYQYQEKYLFINYLNSQNDFYQYDLNMI